MWQQQFSATTVFDAVIDHAANGLSHAGLGTMLLYLLVMTQLTILTVTLYLHRSATHRSVEFHPVVAHFFRFWSWLTTSMVTKEWVAIHRKHHAHSETELDPHSPQIHGIGTLIWQGAELVMDARSDTELLSKYGRGTPEDWIERHLYTPHCNWGPTTLAVINIALFGVGGMAIWAIQMIWIPFWGAGVVNGIGHWWGYRNFETADRSTNLGPFGIWVGGEELHNNHHAYPSSAKFSVRRYEFDVGWLVIRVLEKLGLAKVRRIAYAQEPRMHNRSLARGPQQAALAPRVRVMTAFFHTVTLPAVRDEKRLGRHNLPPPRLRRALADGGCWLDRNDRRRLDAWIDARPCLRTICDFRSRLGLLMEQRDAGAVQEGLSQWARSAEESGIGSLRVFAATLIADTAA